MPEDRSAHKPESSAVNPRELARLRLDVREYSVRELEGYLRRKGVEKEEAHQVVAELRERGLVSDDRYARVIARHQAKRDKGPLAIVQKLGAKGVRVDHRAARALYAEAVDGADEREVVREILERRYPRALGSSDERETRRAYQGLVRRGFSRAIVAELLFRGGRRARGPSDDDNGDAES